MPNVIRSWSQVVWAWTLGGLPSWLILPGFQKTWSHSHPLNHIPITVDDFPQEAIVDLKVGPDLLLEKRLTLPVVARSNFSKVIDLQMRQSLPGRGGDVLWRTGTGQRNGSNITIPIYLLKRSVLEEIHSIANVRKVKLRTISVAHDLSARPFLDNRKHCDWQRNAWSGLAIILLIASIGIFSWQNLSETQAMQNHIANLEIEKSNLSDKAVQMRAALDAKNNSFASVVNDLQKFETEYHRLSLLLDLTEALGDETWVSDLAINGKDLRLSGFTGKDITDVMSHIQELYWVQRVDLDGPVSFDSFSRRHRFDLSIRLLLDSDVSP